MLDNIDRAILALLQQNARISNAEIARQVGMAPSAILERIRKLEERGVILGYEAHINPAALDLDLLAFVLVKTNESPAHKGSEGAISAIPGVQEVHHVAGEDCYLVKVRAASPADLGRVLREGFGAVPQVTGTRSIIVLDTVKESSWLPLDG